MPFLIGWLLNGAYALLLLCVAPVLIYRRLRYGKYKGGWREKLTGALLRRHPDRRCLWFHAVSVGEVLQLQKVLEETAARYPDAELLVTTTTDTGFDVATQKYPACTVAYFPLDFTWAVNGALDAIRPDLVVMVELELWPNFVFACRRRQIALALINGRIGEKSFRGYRRIRPLIRRVLESFDLLAVQNDTYRDRLRLLGAPAPRLVVTGNIKFDRVESNRKNPRTLELRQQFGLRPNETVFIAGSTQSPEELYALDAWEALRTEFPELRLILVPRHKERFEEVANLVKQRNLPLLRRSQPSTESGDAKPMAKSGRTESSAGAVILLDTLGELAACWGLADIAFVGGSLTNRGGQNMLEPAGYGAAVLFGPNTWNFKDITLALIGRDAARVVNNELELLQALRDLVQSPARAAAMGDRARQFVAEQQGATAATVDQLQQVIEPAILSSRAA